MTDCRKKAVTCLNKKMKRAMLQHVTQGEVSIITEVVRDIFSFLAITGRQVSNILQKNLLSEDLIRYKHVFQTHNYFFNAYSS